VDFLPLAVLLPQPTQTHGSPQLLGLGLLAAGNREGLLQAGFGPHRIGDGLPQQQFALEPIRLRQEVPTCTGLQCGEGFGQQAQALLHLARVLRGLGEHD